VIGPRRRAHDAKAWGRVVTATVESPVGTFRPGICVQARPSPLRSMRRKGALR
jgi:hypothetical protein